MNYNNESHLKSLRIEKVKSLVNNLLQSTEICLFARKPMYRKFSIQEKLIVATVKRKQALVSVIKYFLVV